MLFNILQDTGQSPPQRILRPQMPILSHRHRTPFGSLQSEAPSSRWARILCPAICPGQASLPRPLRLNFLASSPGSLNSTSALELRRRCSLSRAAQETLQAPFPITASCHSPLPSASSYLLGSSQPPLLASLSPNCYTLELLRAQLWSLSCPLCPLTPDCSYSL